MRKQKRYFQWIAGEYKGEVVILENIEEFDGETFYNFDDGESCNLRFISKMTDNISDLKEKFMVEIDSPSNPWTFEEVKPKKYIDESMKGQDIDIPSLHDILQAHGENSNVTNSDIGKEKLIPPKIRQRFIELPNIDDFSIKPPEPTQIKPQESVNPVEPVTAPVVQENAPVQPQIEQKQPSFDPVRILVDSCKKHDTQIELSLNMKLPSRTIANIANAEFEDGSDKFIDCVVSDIDTQMIINALKDSLKQTYFGSDDEK